MKKVAQNIDNKLQAFHTPCQSHEFEKAMDEVVAEDAVVEIACASSGLEVKKSPTSILITGAANNTAHSAT